MDKRKVIAVLVILVICVSFYVAIATFIVFQAMQWNFEAIQRNPLSMETIASTFVTAYSIIVWTLILLFFALVIAIVTEILLQANS
jgi:hypothetical protein